ncbi:hypothetical protein [Paraliobacillus sediminis]|uniref:hypothetical protein n=1 Tax=Paraliobacillus sediminis TaxID=1885916 RepID=UPI0013C2FF65|nr:hypothetical protein [Paraliobacillus sediminis]
MEAFFESKLAEVVPAERESISIEKRVNKFCYVAVDDLYRRKIIAPPFIYEMRAYPHAWESIVYFLRKLNHSAELKTSSLKKFQKKACIVDYQVIIDTGFIYR